MIKVTNGFRMFMERFMDRKTVDFDGNKINPIINSKHYSGLLKEYTKKYSNPEMITSFITLVYEYGNENIGGLYQTPSKEMECENIADQLINEITIAIKNVSRSKVIDKHYNFQSNIFEYELESGDFIPCINPEPFKHKIPDGIFPLEFLQVYDPAAYRIETIKEIIK